jgi:signal transduction histidine kinase/AraC-like DNA-binding protein
MKYHFLKTTFLFLISIISSCGIKQEKATYTIGFSQCMESDVWRLTMLEEMMRELSFHPNLRLIYKQANTNNETQARQVRELMDEHIDLLIISPNEAQPLTPVVEEVYKKGIPVVVVDRKISSTMYTAYVGGDNYKVGQLAAQYVNSLLKGKGKIVEVMGMAGTSAGIERNKGFTDELNNYPDLQIIKKVYGNWIEADATTELLKNADALHQSDLIFAFNDVMALGAYKSLKQLGIEKKKIIGVDGLAGPARGLQFVNDSLITATLLYPPGGDEAIRVAAKILDKQSYSKENFLQTSVVDSSNVRLMMLQASKISDQQNSIERQQDKIEEQQRIYKSQSNFLNILAVGLGIVIVLAGIVFYSLRENRKINKKLREQNKAISEQQELLLEMSEKAKTATEAKFNFFTNISHEFRTPLTLILAPIEELLSTPKLPVATRNSFLIVQKNVIRLLRLVNQIMDFRKVDVDKMQLRASENNLVDFTTEIIEAFRTVANKRHIHLRLVAKEQNVPVWFDATMIDKVIFNLLSNAFKFTNDYGSIQIFIEKDDTNNQAILQVVDSGIGMSKEFSDHAFELFFQGDNDHSTGSGLGLALSKELIQLHHGTITLASQKHKGTTFEIRLPLGNKHLSASEMSETHQTNYTLYEDEKIYTTELLTSVPIEINNEKTTTSETTVLIIEDNSDLQQFLGQRLSSTYEVVQALNGPQGLQLAFETVPDLIITDIVMPGMDGISVTEAIKSDIRTSHIPIILLTAKTGIEQQIIGMKSMADAYITKPFNLPLLEQSIQNLLANRARLREHYAGELRMEFKNPLPPKLDRKFINDFSAVVETNISNEDFNVEMICKEMGISRVQLYRKIKALLGCNVNEYILDTRLQKAKHYLQDASLTIAEIAYKVGFSSPAYFSTVFKSKFNVTPKEFREKG